jgi:hypothetical protein
MEEDITDDKFKHQRLSSQSVMLLSDDLLKALALRPNEILEWFVDDRNNEVLIKRHKIIDNKTV